MSDVSGEGITNDIITNFDFARYAPVHNNQWLIEANACYYIHCLLNAKLSSFLTFSVFAHQQTWGQYV